MAKHYYQLFIDTSTGRKLTDFWHSCISVERLAEKYVKRMGAQFYYSDPKYFAGGVACVGFAAGAKIDKSMWREAGEVDNEMQYVPNVDKRIDYVEVPSADYEPQNTFDCIYNPGQQAIERDGKFYRQCLRFEYHEPEGRSANGKRVASREMRRAIKCEIQRSRLPVMRVEPLLQLLGADIIPVGTPEGKPVKVAGTTPTFFAYEHHYYIGCDYECHAEGLHEITPQQHRTAQDMFTRREKKKAN